MAPTVRCSFLEAAKPSFSPSHHRARGTSSCPFYTPGCGGEAGGWVSVRLALCRGRPRPDMGAAALAAGCLPKGVAPSGEGVATWPLIRRRPLDPLAGEASGSGAAWVASLKGFCSWKALAAVSVAVPNLGSPADWALGLATLLVCTPSSLLLHNDSAASALKGF